MVRWTLRFAISGLLGLVALTLPAACGGGDEISAVVGLRSDDGPRGPRVIFDPLRLPIPEVPFPSDLLLLASNDNDAGSVWNISERAPTGSEQTLRGRLNTLDAFGLFAPITVAFDRPLDLNTAHADSVILVNVEPGHINEGKRHPLDFGDGNFPIYSTGQFWGYDPMADMGDWLLPRDNDADFQGSMQRVFHYEVETNTLILRPVVPLDPGCRYAVILTTDLAGPDDDGVNAPIQSAFRYKAHAAMAEPVGHALDLLGMSTDVLAFAWTFKTAEPMRPFQKFRAGLYGEGPMAEMGRRFPANLGEIRDTGINTDADGDKFPAEPQDHPFILQGDYLDDVLSLVGQVQPEYAVSLDYVDYVAFGSLTTPGIRDVEGRMGVNPDTGAGALRDETVPYVIAVPKTTERFKPPFDVVIYFHGTGTSRFEFVATVDNLARQGIATVAFDEVGHGPLIPDLAKMMSDRGLQPALAAFLIQALAQLLVPDRVDEFTGLSFRDGMDALSKVGLFAELAVVGRTVDTNGDGTLESGESFFFADPFKQCGAITQDLVDFMQFVRVLRSFDPDGLPPAISDPKSAPRELLMASILAGDLNADGVLDIGGPDARIGTAGTSLGGIHSVMAAAVEAEVTTVTPIVSGGGLSDILLRSDLRRITRTIYLEIFGPLVIGCPDGAGGMWLSFNNDSERCQDAAAVSFAHLDDMPIGTTIALENLVNGEHREHVLDDVGFSMAVDADYWDHLQIVVERPSGETSEVLVQSPYAGIALRRNTPEFRRFIGINQHALGRCDPINFARHLFMEPLPGHPPTSVLFESALGDNTVPISSGVSLARAAGVMGRTPEEWAGVMQHYIDNGVLLGSDHDPDDVLSDNAADDVGWGPMTPVPSGDGMSSARWLDVGGNHTYIAGVDADFDSATYSRNRLALFHRTGGKVIVDDLCIADDACPLIDATLEELLER